VIKFLNKGGTLFNLIEQRMKMGLNDGLDEIDILEIIGEVSNGIIHLHLQEPAIAHRDIQVISNSKY
jgi:hypothetical protein